MGCLNAKALAAWLDGELSENDAAQAHAHVESCPRCRALNARLRAVVAALPAEAPRDDRFAQEIVERLDSRTPRTFRTVALTSAAALCALVAAPLLLRPSTFTARGGAADAGQLLRHVGVRAFVHPHSDPSRRELVMPDAAFNADDGLSFELTNRTGAPLFALVFGVDARGSVHWFHPAFIDPESDPASLLLPAAPAVTALPEGVTLESPAEGPFQLISAVSIHPLSVSVIERAALQGWDALQREVPDAALQRLPLRVTRSTPRKFGRSGPSASH